MEIYRDQSELVAVFLCKEYQSKEWCRLEWRVIRDIIKGKRGSEVMLLRFDDVPITGLLSIDGYVDIGPRSPEETADIILRRYTSNQGGPWP